MLLKQLLCVSVCCTEPACARLWAIDVVVPVLEKCVEHSFPCEQAVCSPPLPSPDVSCLALPDVTCRPGCTASPGHTVVCGGLLPPAP